MNTTRLWLGAGLTLILLGAVMTSAQPVEPAAVLSAPEVLTLDKAVSEALAANPALHAERAGLESSRWQSRQSWMAYLPNGSWSSSVTRVDEESILYNPASGKVDVMVAKMKETSDDNQEEE